MAIYKFTELAASDLEDIYDQLFLQNPTAASKLLDKVADRCMLLAEYPNSGSNRDELFANLQSVAVDNYTIYFRAEAYGILVVRILHSKRDVEKLFKHGE